MGCWKYNLSDQNFKEYEEKLFANDGTIIKQFLQSIQPLIRVVPWMEYAKIRMLSSTAPPTCGMILIPYKDYGHCVAFYWDQSQLYLFDPALSHTRSTRKSKSHKTTMFHIAKTMAPHHNYKLIYSEDMMDDHAPWQLDSQSLYDGFCHTYCLLWLQSILSQSFCSRARSTLHMQMIDLARVIQTHSF